MPNLKPKIEETIVTYSVLDREISNSDFLKDPDLYRDNLPQPYRRIDKIVQGILEDVWNNIEKNENELKIEQNKHRAQTFDVSTTLDVTDINCMCLSNDDYNDFVFAGSKGFIYAIDTGKLSPIDKFDLNKVVTDISTNIIKIYSSQLKPSVYLIVSITDSGHLFTHVFMREKFYLVQSLTQETDSERKFSYKKCEISKNCEFVAVFIES
ncbi:WD repeat-containing 93-like isoform X5 [Brachionus plicatilis]|uniref:WD repeat-containing 93-like isoform X5 n=1 Tax=Brachionus plicatilis TaxID=10195 RepID=A0A3M7P5W8_BRAPC|nr:WD repeat-containing 93-like isoform X5 [Brachionus plicatilis]